MIMSSSLSVLPPSPNINVGVLVQQAVCKYTSDVMMSRNQLRVVASLEPSTFSN